MAIDLTSFTPARVGLGRTGIACPTAELLRFQLDHARARDAVSRELDPRELLGVRTCSCVARRVTAPTYLRRPDLGRSLSEDSRGCYHAGDYDAAIVMADGLSALAVHRHAAPLLDACCRSGEGRMADGAADGCVAGARGDRRRDRRATGIATGSDADWRTAGVDGAGQSGNLLTYDPRPGRTEAERNCISNVRPEGLLYALAARKLHFLMTEARVRKLTGWR